MVNITQRNLNDLETKLKKYYDTKLKDMEVKHNKELEEVAHRYEEKLKKATINFEKTVEAKISILMTKTNEKDKEIGKLNKDLGELQSSLSYMSSETADLNKKLSSTILIR